ncbi:aldehyde dehydrogenase family 2 member C4-like [Gossypium australe]|uniref:Aldehyde dehydrogenase family 2 member C4-like n=1 Tax=Gossypium australe TaxID=47621 RepID=A0A5B6UZD8_9ROSI|nr:aldehyde dehydrogenase family 2 member C4-like [Gossypium australe]
MNRLPVDSSHMKTCQNIIHSAGAVPSSLHQKLKLVTEGQLVTINAKEDIIASITSDAQFTKTDDEAIECSFRLLEFVNATFIVEGNNIPVPRISKTTKMGLQLTPYLENDSKIPSRKSRGTNADGQMRPLWLRMQVRCETKE